MTNAELHFILDDKNRKLSKKELLEIICELEHDCDDKTYKLDCRDKKYQWYLGESNAFHIALLLAEKLEEN